MGATDVTKAYIVGLRVAGMSPAEISTLTGIKAGTIWRIYSRAKTLGFDPDSKPHNIDDFVTGGRGLSQSPPKDSSAKAGSGKKRKMSKKVKGEGSDDETDMENRSEKEFSDDEPPFADAKEKA